MTYRIKIEATGIEGLKQSQLNKIYRKSMGNTGKKWQKQYLKKHFTKAGAREYHYGAREGEPGSGEPFKGSYTANKQKRFGHQNPLQYTGQAKAEAKRGKVTPRATAKKASVSVATSRKFNFRHPKSKTKPSEEIRRVSRRENKELSDFLAQDIDHGLTKAGRSAGTRVIIRR